MLYAEGVEDLAGGARSAGFQVFEPLTNPFRPAGLGGEIEQILIGVGVLKDGRGPAVNRQGQRTPGQADVIYERIGVISEYRHRLAVTDYVHNPILDRQQRPIDIIVIAPVKMGKG
jgi:hypothetical protein